MKRCAFLGCFLFAGAAFAAGGSEPVSRAAARLEETTARIPVALRMEFRMRAAQGLVERHPELAQKLVRLVEEEIRAGKDWQLSNPVLQGLVSISPSEAIGILPYLGPGQGGLVISELARANHLDEALTLYRKFLSRGELQSFAANQLLVRLVKSQPQQAKDLFRDMLSAAHFDTADPNETFRFLDCAKTVSGIAPDLAADAAERIASAASAPDYGAHGSVIAATYQSGSETIATANSRDTMLVVSGSLLRQTAPARFEEHKALFDRWNLAGRLSPKALSFRSANAGAVRRDGPDTPSKQMSQLRGLPTDADRARLVLEITREIRAFADARVRVNMASSLANLSTEGDLGKEALTAVSETLADALREAPANNGSPYIELASLVRFERLPAPKPDPSLDAAGALIELQEQLHQEAGFTLTGLDGKTYTLAALKGHVVLLNFWATWCPPCRKEMPDMEKLYQALKEKGLIVLAVSDEDRETVANFQEKQKYSFPILLDAGRKVNESFNVEGIPKSFLFDREGKLVAKAIDMRTEAQFLELLKAAGM